MIKRIFSLLLCALLLLLSASCRKEESRTDESGDPLLDKMMDDLIAYTYQNELVNGDLKWALEGMKRFDENRSWENLLDARARIEIAQNAIASCTLPEAELSSEDRRQLINRGIDASFTDTLDEQFSGTQNHMLNSTVLMHTRMMVNIFTEDDWDITAEYVGISLKNVEFNLQYAAYTVDYVLLDIGDDAVTEKFNALMAEYCPLTHAYQATGPRTKEEIEADTNTLLDRIESEVLNEESRSVSAMTERAEITRRAVENNDFTMLGKKLAVTGLPLSVPEPWWLDGETCFYYWKDGDTVLSTPLPGADLPRIPDGCQITVENVTRDEVLEYAQLLENAGLPSTGTSEDNGVLYVFYEFGGSTFALVWEDGTVKILMTEKPVFLAPIWYLTELQ